MLNLCFSSFIKWDSYADFPILDISLPEMTQGSVLAFFSQNNQLLQLLIHTYHTLLLKHRLKVYTCIHFLLERLLLALDLYCQLPVQLSQASKWNFIPSPNPTSSLPRCPFSDVPKSVDGTTTHSVIHVEIAHFQFIFFFSLISTFPHFPSSVDLNS